MAELIPITKINDQRTRDISLNASYPFLVIRLVDLISYKTLKLNKFFFQIKETGGIRNYLNGYEGKIIFSLIAPDSVISKLLPSDYAYIINSIKPDFCTTIDCETYHNEISLSIEEIKNSIIQTKELIKLCPNISFIGLVKGCNEYLVEEHTKLLKYGLGIEDFMFHTGDFLRQGDHNMIILARNLAFKIFHYARNLFLYGMGSQKNLIEFSFAHFYITHNHFVTAINGMKFIGTQKISYGRKKKGYSLEMTKHNLFEMHKNLENSKEQKKLIEGGKCIWAEEKESIVLATVQQVKR